jgi:hypothetical protein
MHRVSRLLRGFLAGQGHGVGPVQGVEDEADLQCVTGTEPSYRRRPAELVQEGAAGTAAAGVGQPVPRGCAAEDGGERTEQFARYVRAVAPGTLNFSSARRSVKRLNRSVRPLGTNQSRFSSPAC